MKIFIFLLCLISLAVSIPIEVEKIVTADEDYTEDYLEEVSRSEGTEHTHDVHHIDDSEDEHNHDQHHIDQEAARNARFNFGYSIQDDINGAVVQRAEKREGLNVSGEYSYSDGFFKRTVAYVADENGYRVTKMTSEAIGNGPVTNKLGRAIVQMFVSGVNTEYAIQAEPMIDDEEISEANFKEATEIIDA